MKKIYLNKQLKELSYYPIGVINSISENIEILNENYEEDRYVDNDLGGYVIIAESIVDIEKLKQNKLQGIMSKYTDTIECKEGVNWTSSLFLLSSNYSIVVICIEELSKFLIER